MARAVNVRIVAICRFVFDVSGVDRDAASLFFRGRVDLIVSLGFTAEVLRERRADGCRQRGLAMVNVTNRANVHVRLRTLKFSLAMVAPEEQKSINSDQIGRIKEFWCP